MSDTKQQCPTCLSRHKSKRVHVSVRLKSGYTAGYSEPCTDPWHDSPVEGSGEPTKCGDCGLPPNKCRCDDPDLWPDGYYGPRDVAPEADSPSAAGSGAREWLRKNSQVLVPRCAHESFLESLGCVKEQVGPHEWRWRNARAEQDGWYLVYADRITSDGKRYGREGEANHGGNCLAWYEHAVFWRERAEAAERELKELREKYDHAVQCVNRNCSQCNNDAKRAALRGKEGE